MAIESVGNQDQPAREKPRGMPPLPRKEAPPLNPVEKARRQENMDAGKTAKSLMENLKVLMRPDSAEGLSDLMEKHDVIDRLMTIPPKATHPLGEPGVNGIEKWVYEEDVAFAKPQLGEASFGYEPDPSDPTNTEKGTVFQITKKFENGKVVVKKERTDNPNIVANVTKRYHAYDEQCRNFEETYKISRIENPIKQDEVTFRHGVQEGGLAKREFTAFALSEAFGLRVVPPTGLKMKPDGSDLFSLQSHVKVENPENPARTLTPEDYKEFLELNPEAVEREAKASVEHLKSLGVHGELLEQAIADSQKKVDRAKTMKKDMMRIAVFDYLIRAQDRHLGNFYLDPETGHVTGIDHGYSLGLSKTVEVKDAKGESKKKLIAMDPYVSAPLEILKAHPDWKLDDEAMAEMNNVFNETLEYLKYRENPVEFVQKNPDKEIPTGQRLKFITETLRFLYGNEDIAKVEAMEVIARRLRSITLKGRPPDLKYMDDPTLTPEEWYSQDLLAPHSRGYEIDPTEEKEKEKKATSK